MEQKAKLFSLSALQSNKKLASFLFCVLLASGIWTVNALNKTQHCTIEVRLNYDQSWLKSWSSGNQPALLKVDLSGRGFDLAAFLLHNSSPEVRINEEGLFNGNKELSSFDLVKHLFLKAGNQVHIDRISPAVIALPVRKPFFKKVAVKPSFDLNMKLPYMISGPAVCVPDSILLSSVKAFPDTFNSIYTMVYKRNNVSSFVFGSVKPDLPLELNLIPELKSVWIYIPVEEATEKVIEVPLEIDFGRASNVEIVPSAVQITCKVPLSKYDQTIPERFAVTADITSESQKRAVVNIKRTPYWADHISVKPATVDYFYRNP